MEFPTLPLVTSSSVAVLAGQVGWLLQENLPVSYRAWSPGSLDRSRNIKLINLLGLQKPQKAMTKLGRKQKSITNISALQRKGLAARSCRQNNENMDPGTYYILSVLNRKNIVLGSAILHSFIGTPVIM